MWDNHEFSWKGYQSQQFFNDPPRPAQTLKLAASQAWYEYQPARVVKQGTGDVFEAPHVDNTPLTTLDARGVGQEPNNLTAIHALRVHRAFRFGQEHRHDPDRQPLVHVARRSMRALFRPTARLT